MRIRRRAAAVGRRRLVHQYGTGPRLRFLVFLLAGAIGIWLFLPVPALTASVPAAQQPAALAGLPWLSVRQQRIVDGSDRTVLLRGFNVNAFLEPTMGPAPLDETDASLLQRSGFNVVRLPIAWSLLEPRRGQFDDAYLERVARAVSLLNAHGLYVVLDMHSLGWSPAYGGSGAPAWATVVGVPDPIWGPMPSAARFLSPAINVSTVYFWLTSDWQSEYLKTWQRVAARFRGESGVAGYDLLNEPHSIPLPPFRFDKDQLFPFYARAIDAVGRVDPNHLFFLDNDMFAAAVGWSTDVVPLSAPNLVYEPHVYRGSLNPPAFTGDPVPLQQHVDELAGEAARVPAALWFGEFSIDYYHPLSEQWVRVALDAFDKHNAGWAWWQWRESSGWGIRNAEGTHLNMSVLRLLARPYLAAAPPGVTARLTGSGPYALTVDVQPAARRASIEMSWPLFAWGPPRLTDTCGAAMSWEPASARVRVDVAPSTSCSIEVSG